MKQMNIFQIIGSKDATELAKKQFDAPVFIKRAEDLFEDLIRKHIPDVA